MYTVNQLAIYLKLMLLFPINFELVQMYYIVFCCSVLFLTFSSPHLEIRWDDVLRAKEILIKFAIFFPNRKRRNIHLIIEIFPQPYHFSVGRTYVHLKIRGSQTNFQQFHDGLDLQVRPFCQCIIVTELISDDLWGFVDWYINERTKTIKANEGI
jgi:hypothetical protein